MAITEKEQRKFRTLLKNMAIHESYEVDIFSWTYCLKYGFDEDEFFAERDFMEEMLGCYDTGDAEAINEFESSATDDDIKKYYEFYKYVTNPHKFSRDLLSAAADRFCEETLKCEYIPSFLWDCNGKLLMFDAFVTGVVNRVNVFIKLGTLFDGVDEFITMDDKPSFETRKPWDSVALHDMNECYAKRIVRVRCIHAEKYSENFRKMLDDIDENCDDLISVDSVVSNLLQCQQEGIKSCRKVLQNASGDEEIFNIATRNAEGLPRDLQSPFWIKFHDYFLKKEK
ncbi:hypothetical protein [Gardnerella vaginalis]|uniref:hypothetical protein n=1 Tax=Gardnerella vaginalis TaxID=2702 RepID=UPI002010A2E4|nr:hypothetical protein [Gardnerella vaginalis]UQA89612.1 hypothetical protein K9E36_05665 [Gardnerella vaginalis]